MLRLDFSNYKFNIYFEYVAVFILIIMLIYMFIEKLVIMKKSKLVVFWIILSLITSAVDIYGANTVNNILDGKYSTDLHNVVNIFETTYLLFLFISVYISFTYIVHITCGFRYIRKKKLLLILSHVPVLLGMALIIVNYFYPIIMEYGYDKNLYLDTNVYTLLSIYLVEILYLVISLFLIYKYRNLFENKQRKVAAVYPLILVFAIIFEFIFSNYLIVGLATSLCIVIVYNY